MSKSNSNEKAIDKLFLAWCVVGFVRQALNESEGDEVPFSSSLLEGTLHAAEHMLGGVHQHFSDLEVTKARGEK